LALAQVTVTIAEGHGTIAINGKPFTSLYPGADVNRPFLYPLLTASGKRVTRGFPIETLPGEPTDHPHQRGLFVASQNVSGYDFWENDPTYKRATIPGKIVFREWLESKSGAAQGKLGSISDWVSKEGAVLLTEKRTMTFYAEPRDCRMFDVDVTFTARQAVIMEDNHDAIVGLRLGPAFDPKNGGLALNAEGLQNQAEIRSQKSPWVDWQATLEGERAGFMLMDHPSNLNFPARWDIRDYGLLMANPFGNREFFTGKPSLNHEGGYRLAAGESIRLRYRILIHPLRTDVRAQYKKFAEGM
jgi:Methane oxygenase PmoA